jgi:hypothetical protein
MPSYKLFSTARSYSLSMIKTFLHHMVIFYRYNFTHASLILCSKSLVHLHLYFLGRHLYIYKCLFYFLFPGLSNTTFFSQAYIVPTTRGHHTIIFHTTFLSNIWGLLWHKFITRTPIWFSLPISKLKKPAWLSGAGSLLLYSYIINNGNISSSAGRLV